MNNHELAAPAPTTGWAAIRQTWVRPQLWINVALVTLPSVVFLVVNAAAGLRPAIAAAAVVGVAGVVVRLVRRDPVRSAVIGFLLVAACATVATVTGEARGFFLVPTLVPFVVIIVCLVTVVARRPLTGLLLNRVTGGPKDWYRQPRLRRVHFAATSAAIGINVVNAFVQVFFYIRNDTVVLAAAHAATGPIFAALVAVTLVAARKAVSSSAGPARS